MVCYPFCAIILYNARSRRLAKEASLSQQQEDDSSREGSQKKGDEIRLWDLVTIARFFFGLIS